MPRIANNRIHMTMKESWPVCSTSSSPHDYPVSCELSHHLYLIRHFSSSDHWAWVFVLLTLEAQLISRLYAARILIQSKKKSKMMEKIRKIKKLFIFYGQAEAQTWYCVLCVSACVCVILMTLTIGSRQHILLCQHADSRAELNKIKDIKIKFIHLKKLNILWNVAAPLYDKIYRYYLMNFKKLQRVGNWKNYCVVDLYR